MKCDALLAFCCSIWLLISFVVVWRAALQTDCKNAWCVAHMYAKKSYTTYAFAPFVCSLVHEWSRARRLSRGRLNTNDCSTENHSWVYGHWAIRVSGVHGPMVGDIFLHGVPQSRCVNPPSWVTMQHLGNNGLHASLTVCSLTFTKLTLTMQLLRVAIL